MKLGPVLRASSILLFLAACASACIWLVRRPLPYNAEGRYFDETSGVVMHEQTLTVAGAAAVSLAVFAVICWLIAKRT